MTAALELHLNAILDVIAQEMQSSRVLQCR